MDARRVGLAASCLMVLAGLAAAPAGAATFSTNEALKAFNGGGPLLPYPSVIVVQGQQGTVSGARATLSQIAYGDVDELEAVLVAPSGQRTLLMQRPCSGQNSMASPLTFTFDDAAEGTLPNAPTCTSGTFSPSEVFPAIDLPHPAPSTPYPVALAALSGAQPNGLWKLFVYDQIAAVDGEISGGWSLDLTTTGAPANPPANLPLKTKKTCKKRKHHAATAKKKRCKKRR